MKRIYTFALCAFALAASVQPAVTASRESSAKSTTQNVPKNAKQTKEKPAVFRADDWGERLDLELGFGTTQMKAKPLDANLSMLGGGLSATGYKVAPDRKNAIGAIFDLSFNQASSYNISHYSIMVGPAYSYNFSPFGKRHICLDFAAGYLFREHSVSNGLKTRIMGDANGLKQHTLAIKAGISLFMWLDYDSPMMYRLTFGAPVGGSLLMRGNKKKLFDQSFGNSWNIGLSVGWRFGRY